MSESSGIPAFSCHEQIGLLRSHCPRSHCPSILYSLLYLCEVYNNDKVQVILKVLKIAQAFRRVQFENFQNHECLLFTNCTRRSCDFLFIVHSTKLRRFYGNFKIGTPTEYNLGLILLLATNQN